MFTGALIFKSKKDIINANECIMNIVCNLPSMRTKLFNQSLSSWDVSSVTVVNTMSSCYSIWLNIGNWNMGNVTNVSNTRCLQLTSRHQREGLSICRH